MSIKVPVPCETMHEFVIRKLKEHSRDWDTIAKVTKVNWFTIKKIATREVKNPGILNLEPIANYFLFFGVQVDIEDARKIREATKEHRKTLAQLELDAQRVKREKAAREKQLADLARI